MPEPTVDAQGNKEGTPAATSKPAAASTSGGTPAVDLNALLADNKRLADERTALAKQYGDLRKFSTQKSQEAAEYKRRLEAAASASTEYDFGDPNPPARATASSIDSDRLQQIEANQAIINFKLDHSDWDGAVEKDKDGRVTKTTWQAINELLDETNPVSATLAGATPYLTLKNAYREVLLQQLQRERPALLESRGASDAQRATLRAQASISGQSATEGTEALDLNDPNLTADDLLKIGVEAGIFKLDPNDLPLSMRGRK